MKKYIILILMLLISIAVVSAEDYEYKITSIRSQIDSGETAQFLITITSNMNSIKEFRVYSPDVEWGVPTEVIKAYPNTDTNYKLIITPSKYVEPGKIYGIKVNIKDDAKEEIVHSEIIQVNVKSSMKAVSAYRPSVRMTAEVPAAASPQDTVTVKVKLENQNLLNLTDLVLKVSSEVVAFEAEEAVELMPLGKKIIELNYNPDPLQEPGEYVITFELMQGDEVVESEIKVITIGEVNPDFGEVEAESGFLFRTVIRKTFTSTSNVETAQEVLIETNAVKSLFTSTIPDGAMVLRNNKRYIGINLELQPGESKDVVVIVNYRILIYILLAILILTGIYYRYKSPLNIRKGVSDVNTKEGGISEMKITLELTSNASKTIKNVVVTDYIPNIAEIEKEFAEGTLKPSRVFRHRVKGTVIKWEIPEIAPGEDRLISYNVRSKLSIIGNFTMPRAKIIFKKKGREIISYSNIVGVSS